MQNLGQHPPLNDRAYEQLREAILRREFLPGERLFEADLAKRLGISRSPVREAIRRLQQDGLVEIKPRSGVFVATISIAEIDSLYRTRRALEGVAACLAAERASEEELSELQSLLERGEQAVNADDYPLVVSIADDFHRAIHAAAKSQRLFMLLGQIYGQVMQFRNVTLRMPGRAVDALHGHADLLEYLKARDADAAEQAMRRHVDEARVVLLQEVESESSEDERKNAWE